MAPNRIFCSHKGLFFSLFLLVPFLYFLNVFYIFFKFEVAQVRICQNSTLTYIFKFEVLVYRSSCRTLKKFNASTWHPNIPWVKKRRSEVLVEFSDFQYKIFANLPFKLQGKTLFFCEYVVYFDQCFEYHSLTKINSMWHFSYFTDFFCQKEENKRKKCFIWESGDIYIQTVLEPFLCLRQSSYPQTKRLEGNCKSKPSFQANCKVMQSTLVNKPKAKTTHLLYLQNVKSLKFE